MKVLTPLKIFLILILFSSVTNAQEKKFTEYTFPELLRACDLSFKMPRGFKETPVIPDNGHLYQYAIKDSATGFEVRFYIRPYAVFSKDTLLATDKFTRSFFVSSALDASGMVLPNIPPIEEFEQWTIKKENNADFGLLTSFRAKSKFSEGYQYCSVFLLKKRGVGEVTVFQLFNVIDRETEVIIGSIPSSIKFK